MYSIFRFDLESYASILSDLGFSSTALTAWLYVYVGNFLCLFSLSMPIFSCFSDTEVEFYVQ